jgi:hypothetical protein
VGNLDRQSDWRTASGWTRNITRRWAFLKNLDAERPIEFLGVPETHRSAWVFRNGFESMVRLYWEGRPYRLEGSPFPEGAPERMVVVPQASGAVGMRPARLRGLP